MIRKDATTKTTKTKPMKSTDEVTTNSTTETVTVVKSNHPSNSIDADVGDDDGDGVTNADDESEVVERSMRKSTTTTNVGCTRPDRLAEMRLVVLVVVVAAAVPMMSAKNDKPTGHY